MCSIGQWRDMLMCSFGQKWICSYAVMVNNGYAHVWEWSLVDMLRCRASHWFICLCAEVVNTGYAQVQWWSLVDMLICGGGYVHV